MRHLEEDIQKIISGCVLINRRILDQEQLLLEVPRKKVGEKKWSNWRGPKEAELAGKEERFFQWNTGKIKEDNWK